LPNAIWAGNLQISGNTNILVDGRIIGDEWGLAPEDTNTWTPISSDSNTWVEVDPASNSWIRQ
jgi:hypothetical protein